MNGWIIDLNICLQQEDELPKWRSLTVWQAVPCLWDLQTNVQQMKAKLHPPSPDCCPGSGPCSQLSEPLLRPPTLAGSSWCSSALNLVSWDCCQGHHAARGRSADYYQTNLPIALILSWGQWEGRKCRRPEDDFVFLLNCSKRQGCWNVRRGMTLRKTEKSGCCFTNSFLVFTLIYSGNLPEASVAIWNEAAEGGTADRSHCNLWVYPCRWWCRLGIQVWVVTIFRFVLPGCSYFWVCMTSLAKTLVSRSTIHQAVS